MSGERRSLLCPDVPRWKSEDGPIVELRNICKSFGSKQVLSDLNLSVEVGKTTVILGQSGSGKSVLLKHMNALIKPDAGEVRLFGEDLSTLSEFEINKLRKRTGMVLQDYALIDSDTVFQNVAFPLTENTNLKDIRERVEQVLEPLGLIAAMDRYPSELSGGMKKRVSFARATIHEPELVFFDEPTTGLDPVMIEFVDKLIMQMREKYAITSVIISHDIQSIYRLADTMALLNDGDIRFIGTPESAKKSTYAPLRQFLDAGDKEREESDKMKNPSPLIEVKDLRKSFGDNNVLKGIDLKIYEKEITFIIGGSGSGKSVLLKHILGLFRADSGELRVQGLNLGEASEKDLIKLRTELGMLFQGAALFDSLTIFENIAFPLVERRFPPPKKEIRERVMALTEKLNLSGLENLFPASVSAGQRKRIALARAIITEPQIMIYDEPTTGQDPIMLHHVDEMIVEAHKAFNLTTIVISHDMASTFGIADRVAMVYQGKIAAFGTPKQLLQSDNPQVREFMKAGGLL